MNSKNKLSKSERLARDKAIQEWARVCPELTYEELANMFGIKSKQHIYWIIKKGLKTASVESVK